MTTLKADRILAKWKAECESDNRSALFVINPWNVRNTAKRGNQERWAVSFFEHTNATTWS